ncbi:hypothetical protein ACFL9T_11720 [Thermodesulfobacteriota bacterium]
MANQNKKSAEIAEAFTRSVESRDKSHIEKYNREELEIALLQLIGDSEQPYYIAMQIRREELKAGEGLKNEKRAKWKKRIKTIIGGVILGLILVFLKLIYFP